MPYYSRLRLWFGYYRRRNPEGNVAGLFVALTIGLFALTLLGVLIRPKHLSEAWFAAGGAVAMLLCGRVRIAEVGEILRQSGDVLLFLLFLMALSSLVDTSGFFDWAATLAARATDGNPRRLLIGVYLLGAAITILLSLDTTALLLTPLVWAMATRADLPPRPYMFTCAFVANIASSALPVSNLTNLLAFHQLGDTTAHYTLIMTPVTIASSLVALSMIFFVFRKELPLEYRADTFPDPLDAVPDLPYFRVTLVILCLTLIGYFVGPSLLHSPLWMVAAVAATTLALIGRTLGRVRLRTLATRGIAWSVFPFVIGMFIVIRGVENIGLALWLGDLLKALGGRSMVGQIFATGFGTALGANLINNIPMQLLALSALAVQGKAALYASVLGCNLGPNITVVGSLATMLWRATLSQRGMDITPKELARAGILVTAPALLTACLVLWIILYLFGLER
jgi:arsenical pump membrane protein